MKKKRSEKLDFQKGKFSLQINLIKRWISVKLAEPLWDVLPRFLFQKKRTPLFGKK